MEIDFFVALYLLKISAFRKIYSICEHIKRLEDGFLIMLTI